MSILKKIRGGGMGGKGCLLATLSLEEETVAWEGEIVDLWRENLLASRGLDFLPSTLPPHRTPSSVS